MVTEAANAIAPGVAAAALPSLSKTAAIQPQCCVSLHLSLCRAAFRVRESTGRWIRVVWGKMTLLRVRITWQGSSQTEELRCGKSSSMRKGFNSEVSSPPRSGQQPGCPAIPMAQRHPCNTPSSNPHGTAAPTRHAQQQSRPPVISMAQTRDTPDPLSQPATAFFLSLAPWSGYSRRSPESESTTKNCTRQERWQRCETKVKLNTQMMSARK